MYGFNDSYVSSSLWQEAWKHREKEIAETRDREMAFAEYFHHLERKEEEEWDLFF